MICSKCGVKLSDSDHRYCQNCGAEIITHAKTTNLTDKPQIEPEKPKEVEANNLWIGFILIAIGILIIGMGIVGYYIEKVNCYNPAVGCGILTGGGGMGLFGVNFLGLFVIIGGILFPYRKHRIAKRILPLLFIIVPTLAFFLSFIIVSFNF
ncbi:MAG: hypothetical protein ACFFA8_04985 [Promethearchaeota archaeon]